MRPRRRRERASRLVIVSRSVSGPLSALPSTSLTRQLLQADLAELEALDAAEEELQEQQAAAQSQITRLEAVS